MFHCERRSKRIFVIRPKKGCTKRKNSSLVPKSYKPEYGVRSLSEVYYTYGPGRGTLRALHVDHSPKRYTKQKCFQTLDMVIRTDPVFTSPFA